jgi:integrase
VSKHAASSKLTPTYWQERVHRNTFTQAGSRRVVGEFCAQIQYGGQRRRVSLGTNDREQAARKAAKFYAAVRLKGWAVALAEFAPDRAVQPKNVLSVGDFLSTARTLLAALDPPIRERSFANYSYALRKIAVEGIGDRRADAKRFDPVRCPWRKQADRVLLGKLTPQRVEKWKANFVAAAGRDKLAEQRARRSVNSYLGNARALFSRRALEAYSKAGVKLPTPLPFDGVKVETKARIGSLRYVSAFDAGKLLQSAREQLREADPDAYKTVLLALGAGLRRAEIDNLQWPALDFEKSEIRVLMTADFQPKSVESEAPVFVDAGLLQELKALRGTGASLYVVEPGTPRAETHAAQYYRCEPSFRRTTSWLRKEGVLADRPLHVLRKEFGSVVCQQSDIYTASRQLRHADIETTAAYYTDHRKRSVVNVGAMLAGKTATQ